MHSVNCSSCSQATLVQRPRLQHRPIISLNITALTSEAVCPAGPLLEGPAARADLGPLMLLTCWPLYNCSSPSNTSRRAVKALVLPHSQRESQHSQIFPASAHSRFCEHATSRCSVWQLYARSTHSRCFILQSNGSHSKEPMRVMISGAPATGKGTQCSRIVEKVCT